MIQYHIVPSDTFQDSTIQKEQGIDESENNSYYIKITDYKYMLEHGFAGLIFPKVNILSTYYQSPDRDPDGDFDNHISLFPCFYFHFFDLTVELRRSPIVCNLGSFIHSHIRKVIHREYIPLGTLDPPFCHLLAIDTDRTSSSFSFSTAIIFEIIYQSKATRTKGLCRNYMGRSPEVLPSIFVGRPIMEATILSNVRSSRGST
jgi:hypothetical protein